MSLLRAVGDGRAMQAVVRWAYLSECRVERLVESGSMAYMLQDRRYRSIDPVEPTYAYVHGMMDLLDGQRLHAHSECHNRMLELLTLNLAVMVQVHDIYQLFQMVICVVDHRVLEERGDDWHSFLSHFLLGRTSPRVHGERPMYLLCLCLERGHELVQLLPGLVDAVLILLEHALADDAGQKRDHAEAADDDEDHQEEEEDRPLPREALLADVVRQVRRGHEDEEREHRRRDVGKLLVQELRMLVPRR